MKLLIAPWGNPFAWKEVRYRFGEVEVTSKTSLKVLQEALRPDRTVILVGDSLLESFPEDESYETAKTVVKEKIKEFLKNCQIVLDQTQILVLPGRGYFPNGVFKGAVLDYYYCFLYELAQIFNENDFKEVHLDLTHGLNFMPVLTYRAVKEILQVVSFFETVKFLAYNADPFSGTSEEILTLHLVEETEEAPRFPALSPYEANESARLFEKVLLDEKGQKLKTVDKAWLKEVLTFLGGMVYGLPLILTTFFVPSNEILRHLKETLEIYETAIEIKINSEKQGQVYLNHRARLTPLFRVLVLAWLVSKLFEKTKIIEKRCEEILLEDFKKIKEKIFERENIFKSVLGTEINNLRNRIKKVPAQWTFLAKIEKNKVGSPDERNFFAHGGLEKNTLEVCQVEGRLKMRYAQEKRSNIQTFILRSLR